MFQSSSVVDEKIVGQIQQDLKSTCVKFTFRGYLSSKWTLWEFEDDENEQFLRDMFYPYVLMETHIETHTV
jgi:hypothetical protein